MYSFCKNLFLIFFTANEPENPGSPKEAFPEDYGSRRYTVDQNKILEF